MVVTVVLCGLCVLLGRTEADLVLAGGGLEDNNGDVYGTFVDLAVSILSVYSMRVDVMKSIWIK